MEQKLITRPENTSSPPVLVGFVLFDLLCVCFVDHFLSFFFWPLCCLSFFDLRIPITPLVSSISSFDSYKTGKYLEKYLKYETFRILVS